MDPTPSYFTGMADELSDPTLKRAMRRHTWQRFEEIACQAAQHLPLTPWEVNFLASLAAAGTQSGGDMALSDKQLTVLLRLEDRLKVQQILDLARGHPGQLSAWEEDFLTTLVQSPAALSDKQVRMLLRIQDKMAPPAAAALSVNPEPQLSSAVDSGEPADAG
jgi:hypothetical protein